MKKIIKLYDPIEFILIILSYCGACGAYYYLLTRNLAMSAIVGIVFGLACFYSMSFKTRKITVQQKQLNSILKYVTNMIFYLQVGENIKQAYQTALNNSDKYIKKDLLQTIKHLEEDARLVTEHFKKYNFHHLDQFHQNLEIKYELGGDAKELFSPIQRNILFELKKRDELFKRKSRNYSVILIMLGLVLLIPVFLRTSIVDVWILYQQSNLATPLLIITLTLIWFTIHLAQKNRTDISIRA